MLPENVTRDLRTMAGILRAIEVYDPRVVEACRRIAGELDGLADRLEEKELPGH
jgi:hypothetical protein